jgi:hypothetical protein
MKTNEMMKLKYNDFLNINPHKIMEDDFIIDFNYFVSFGYYNTLENKTFRITNFLN